MHSTGRIANRFNITINIPKAKTMISQQNEKVNKENVSCLVPNEKNRSPEDFQSFQKQLSTFLTTLTREREETLKEESNSKKEIKTENNSEKEIQKAINQDDITELLQVVNLTAYVNRAGSFEELGQFVSDYISECQGPLGPNPFPTWFPEDLMWSLLSLMPTPLHSSGMSFSK